MVFVEVLIKGFFLLVYFVKGKFARCLFIGGSMMFLVASSVLFIVVFKFLDVFLYNRVF